MRGAPGNTISHRTSYWVPNHSPQVFVPKVDVVSGVGNDRAAALGPQSARFHDLRRVVSNLGVFDFATPERRMRLASVHPGVTVEEVVKATGFELVIPTDVPETRAPSDAELRADPRAHRPRGPREQGSARVGSDEERDASPPHTTLRSARLPRADRPDRHGLGGDARAHGRGLERGRLRLPRRGDDPAARGRGRDRARAVAHRAARSA